MTRITKSTKGKPCFLCNEPTNEIQDYPRIINIKPFPMCKKCQEIIANA